MDIKKLDSLSTRDLRAVTILADVGNFHRAAAMCSVTQPALSAIVKKIESRIGIKLFERSSRSFRITESGLAAIERIRSALLMLEGISHQAEKRPLEGLFRLGFIPTIGPYLIPSLIRPLLKRFTRLELFLAEAPTGALVDLLIERQIDAAIVALPVSRPRILEEALFQEELVLAAPASHALAKRARVTISQVKQSELLLMEQGHCLRKHTLEACGSIDKQARTVHSASLETLLYMVQAGLGYTVVPRMVAESKRQGKGIEFVRFTRPAPTRTVGLIALRQGPADYHLEALLEFLRAISRG